MTTRRLWSLAVVTMVVVAGLFFVGCGGPKVSPTLKIGVVAPLTGDAATFGNNVRKGAELALEEAKKRGDLKGIAVEILSEDSKGEAKSGVAAMNKLATVDQVVAVVDDCVSSVALAIVPLANQHQIPIVSAGSTNPKLSGMSKYFYRVWNSDAEEGVFSARYAVTSLGLKKAAILYINNDYGKGLSDVFGREFKARGGAVVLVDTFDQGASTFRSQLAKVKAASPDCVYVVGYSSDLPILLKQLREAAITATVIGTVTAEDPVIVKGAGAAAEGVVYPFPKEPFGSTVTQFRQAYEAKFGEKPGLASDTGYDSAAVILECIRHGARTGPEIQAALATTKGFRGASGEITFDEKGEVHKPMVMKTIRGGKFVQIAE